MRSIVFIAMMILAAFFVIADTSAQVEEADNCKPKAGMKKAQCDKKIKKGCKNLQWLGLGCCKTKKAGKCTARWGDGGCKIKGFCDFKCREKCGNVKGCQWKNDKCQTRVPDSPYEEESEYYGA